MNCFIHKLPHESLSHIFHFVVEDPETPKGRLLYGANKTPPCFTLSHVCKLWREICLGNSTLWTKIDCLSTNFTRELLARSKEAPLIVQNRVGFSYDEDAVLESVNLALSHMPRVRELSLHLEDEGLSNLFSQLTMPAPLLERLSVENTTDGEVLKGFVESTFAGVAPKLRLLSFSGCWPSRLDLPIFKDVLHLRLTGFPDYGGPEIAEYISMLAAMPKLEHLVLDNAVPHYQGGGSRFTPPSDRTVVTLPNLSRLSIAAISETENNVADIAYILCHLSVPALRHLRVDCGAWEDLFKLQPLLPVLAPYCHGPQDSAPIQTLALVNLKWIGVSENNFMGVQGWTNSYSTDDAVLQKVLADPHGASDSARFRFGFENVDSVDSGNLLRSLTKTLDALPLSNVKTLVVDHIISYLEHASWWTENHFRFPSLNRLHVEEGSFNSFCYAVTMNKATPVMNHDKEYPLAFHRFMKHPEKKAEYFSVPSTLQEIVFPELRFLTLKKAMFQWKVLSDLFIEALSIRRDLGVGIQEIVIKECMVDKVYIARLKEVVPNVIWDEKEGGMKGKDKWHLMDVDSDGGEAYGEGEGGSDEDDDDY